MRRLNDDQGGVVAITVAVMLVMFFGFAAISVDVGAIYLERRELQNGADAAALAIADECALGTLPCVSTGSGCPSPAGVIDVARTYADANAGDGAAEAACVELDTSVVPNTVTVTTRTQNAEDGSDQLDFAFAPVLGIDGTTVEAEATASWAGIAMGSIPTLPLTFSQCEYDRFLASGRDPKDTHAPWTAAKNGTPQIIKFHKNTDECHPHSSSGLDLPGGFGWLVSDGACEVVVSGDGTAASKTGRPPSDGCTKQHMLDEVVGQVVLLPVFDGLSGGGSGGEFSVYTYAAFYVTGYHFNKHNVDTPPSCGGSVDCLEGWFTTATTSEGEPSGECSDVCNINLTS